MGWLLKTALVGWWNDRAMSLGASIAFFTVFSLAPMLLVAIAVAGLAFGHEAAQGAIVAQLGGLAGGQTAAALEAMIASANNLGSGVIGIIITVILQILNSAIAFGIAALLFAMIFKILPAVPLTWRDVGMGASMTALLFTAGKFVIGYYIGKSGVASAYGAAASIITLLLWIYYSSLILLFGAEFTKAYAENRGSRTEVPINPRQGLSFLRHRSGTEAEPRLRSGPLCARSCHPAGTSSFPISDIRGTGSS